LGLTQPTLGRQVAALEEELGVTLFERVGRSMSLTQSGLQLLDHVRAMGDAAGRISLTASGQSQAIEGQVRITASDVTCVYHLPDVLKRLREIAPGIEVEVVAANDVRDLQRREADIAIRHVRPDQPDLIARLLGETSGHLYAATTYLDAHGRPGSANDLADAAFIGIDDSERMLANLHALGLPVTQRNIRFTTGSGVVMWELIKQGLGIGLMVKDVAAVTPGVECVLPELETSSVPIWLTTHRELHTSRRIRLVFDLLAEAIA